MSRPTLRWIRVTDPGESVPLGEEDYVLEAVLDGQRGAWEVLVLLQPTEDADED